jgi:FtsH-binding integral membrane protein
MHTSTTYEYGICAADAEPSVRATFIRSTYAHLAGAIAVFALLEAYLLSLPIAQQFTAYATNRYVWLGILGGYMAVSYIAEEMAQKARNIALQYFALAIYVVAEAILFVPLLTMAQAVSRDIIPTAALLTGTLTGGLTLVVVSTKRDFSFLRNFLVVGGFVALGLIIGSAIFGFGLGMIFSAAMIVLACAAILFATHNVMSNYQTNQPIAAALSLFAAVALLFWYIVRILIQLSALANRD